jgi:ferritin-like metal-binding protein YciE
MKATTHEITTLHELFLDQLRDLYDAENRLVDALPKMAEAATAAPLKKGFNDHLEQTREHVNRLEKIFAEFDEDPEGKTCQAMKGLIKEGHEAITEHASPEVRDAALIAAAQRVEHYEIAGYGTVRTYAKIMHHKSAVDLLQKTLNEEAETDKKLTAAAEKLNAKVPIGHEK